MKKILVTGGTVFVSRYIAEYYVKKGYEVYVLNRNTHRQSAGVHLLCADRHALGDILRQHHFHLVIDTAYTSYDVFCLLNALDSYDDYALISSSAVYPQDAIQPFIEDTRLGRNSFWGNYGTDKIAAEETLMKQNPNAYILRPPYIYGPMNNVYREAFVFDCALQRRKFYLPQKGEMNLQFFHIHDLCRFIDALLKNRPRQHIYNVGNPQGISIRKWVELCYQIVGTPLTFVNVNETIEQREYFSFYNYEYCLDISRQEDIMKDVTSLSHGLKESFDWYIQHSDEVHKKPYIAYIDQHFKESDS